MWDRFINLVTSISARDFIEISLLAVAFYWLIRLLGRTRGAGMVRGLGMFLVGI